METNNQIKLNWVKEVAMKLTPRLPYHNIQHIIDVYSSFLRLVELEKINEEDKFLLESAIFLHDIVYAPWTSDNEEKSSEFAGKILLKLGYSKEQIRKIKELILATKLPQNPLNLLEKIICDADLDHLGREDCLEKGEKYRRELGIPKEKWIEIQLQFLQEHKYHTKSARKLRDKGKRENIWKLKKLLGNYSVGGLKC